MKVQFNDFTRDPEALILAELQAVEKVIRSGWFVLGPMVEQFEQAWAHYCGVKASVGVANGMDALEIILRCRDIGPGDEVITTGLTAFATTLAILRVGATPVFADVNAGTALLDLESVKDKVNSRTRAVVLVHLYGQLQQMEKWRFFCDEASIDLVEDCAQAHGASYGGQIAGSFGVAGAYSFYPTKNLGCVGDGGAIVSNDMGLIERAKKIRNYGQVNRYEHAEFGMNSRLDEIQAAILLERLKWLGHFNERRRSIFKRYSASFCKGFARSVQMLDSPNDPSNHVHHLIPLRSQRREEFQSALAKLGVSTIQHYPIPCYDQAACSGKKAGGVRLQNTKSLCAELFSLPCHPNLTEKEIDYVINSVLSVSEDLS